LGLLIIVKERFMSVEEFVREVQKEHEEDIKEIVDLLKILDQMQGEKQVYELFVTSNL
jgi:hypothetical protein